MTAYPSSMQPADSYKPPQAAKVYPAPKAMCIITGLEAAPSMPNQNQKNLSPARPGDLRSNKSGLKPCLPSKPSSEAYLLFKATLKFLMYGVKVKFLISRIYTNPLIEQKKTRKMSPGITEVPRLNYIEYNKL